MKIARILILLSVFALLPLSVGPLCIGQRAVLADEPQQIIEDPQFVDVSTPQYRAYESDFEPHMGKYTYEVSWNGIPAAEATITVGSDDFRYHLVADARTYSPINLFYDLHFVADGLISAIDMLPLKTSISQQENSRLKTIEMNFRGDGNIESVRSQTGKPTKVLRFNTNNMTLDPFGAAFLARGLDWKVGESKYFDTFNGKTRYLITMTAKGKEEIKVNGEKRNCWVIVPTVRKLNSNEEQHKLREARIYMTEDKNRDVVKIVSEVFIGAVTTKLINYEPADTPAPIRMAQLRARPIIK